MSLAFWLMSGSPEDPPSGVPRGEAALELPLAVRSRGDKDTAHATAASQIRAGDIGAFEQLYREYYTSLVYFALALLGSIDSARDVVGDVFLNLWHHRTTWSPNQGVRAYLFGAVRNRASNVRRDRQSEARRDVAVTTASREEQRVGGGSYVPPADAALVEREVAERVWRAVGALPERARLVVQLRWREGMDFGEIASVLGITRASAHVLHSRAIATLRERLALD